MPSFEYKVLPAPVKGAKARGVRASEDRFALALERLMNEMGEDGWQFHRAETLPQEERKGLTQTITEWRNVLVFRRERVTEVAFQPKLLEKPREDAASAPAPSSPLVHAMQQPAPQPTALPHVAPPADPFGHMTRADATPEGEVTDAAEQEATEEVTSISSALRARAAKLRSRTTKPDMAAE